MGPPGGPKDAWAVYNGSLYLNVFAAVREQFFDPSTVVSNIAHADARWEGM